MPDRRLTRRTATMAGSPRKRKRVERDLIAGLRQFVRKLKSGEPIEVTTVRREETPDGPMHTRERRVLRKRT